MIVGILLIIIGIWMNQIAKHISYQQKREMFDQWALQREMIDDALNQIDTRRRQSVEILRIMSDRIKLIEDKKENVLQDFKRMLYS